jgi:Protein of unknown function (DUF1153)
MAQNGLAADCCPVAPSTGLRSRGATNLRHNNFAVHIRGNGPFRHNVGQVMLNQLKLPPAGAMIWGTRRKAAVVQGIRAGMITHEEACARYLLSPEKFAAWDLGFDQGGTAGLSTKSFLRRRERGQRLARGAHAG